MAWASAATRLSGECTSKCHVLQDVKQGWEGFCLGLEVVNTSTTADACREVCCADPNCEVWQWGNVRHLADPKGLGACNVGKGIECRGDRFDDFLVLAGQRISHGTVVDTIDLEPGQWCVGRGMEQANISVTGVFDAQRLKHECRDACYSDATCSIWELSSTEGCWHGYSEECQTGSLAAKSLIAGQRVAHACGPAESPAAHTDYFVVFGIIGFVGLVMALLSTVFLICCSRGPRAPAAHKPRSTELLVENGSNGQGSHVEDISRDSSQAWSAFQSNPGNGSRIGLERGRQHGNPSASFHGSSFTGSTPGSFTPLMPPPGSQAGPRTQQHRTY